MSKETRKFALLILALLAIVIGALLVNGYPAEAHDQLYPHSHPHMAVALFEDFLLNGLWLGIWAGIVLAGRSVYRQVARRRIGK